MTNLFIEFLKLLIRISIGIILLPRLIIRKYFNNKNANINNVNKINTNNINANKSERKEKRNKYGFPTF